MKSLIKSLGAFSVGPMLGAVIGFITVPTITYFISPEEYGKSSMFVLAQGTLSMLMYLGMDQAFVREFNHYKDRKNKLMSNAIIVPMCSVVICSSVIITFRKYFANILFDDVSEILPVIALAIMLPFMVVENFALLKIRMEEHGLQYSLFTVLLKVFTLIFTVLLIVGYEKSFRSVVYAIAISEILNGILLLIAVKKDICVSIRYFDASLIKEMLKYGLPLIPAAMLGWALTSMDKIMLRSMCTYEELGLYSAAFKIVNIIGIIQTCFTLFWTPVALRWYGENKGKHYFDIVGKIVATIMTVMCLGLLLFKDIVAIILGDDFTKAIYIFPFLLLQPIMYTMSEATGIGIAFTRNTKYNILVSALSGVTNIMLNYLLIPIYGGEGAAIATGISYIVFFWSRTIISIKVWEHIKLYKYFVCTVLIVINCVCHTLTIGIVPYVVTLATLIFIICSSIKDGKDAYKLIKEL